MSFIFEYGLFLAKAVTVVLAIVVILISILAIGKQRSEGSNEDGHLQLHKLNEVLDDLRQDMQSGILEGAALKKFEKEEQRKLKEREKNQVSENATKRVFVLDFDGDVRASEVENLRRCITAILQVARRDQDEVVLRLESPGGMVHAYGLAASQLTRLGNHGLALTICVDKVAASGGYMMACVANQLIASPFAYIGSIGVLVQLPNVHRLLTENKIDYEMITAGEYKRTLTTLGENTEAGRLKVQEEVNTMHELFKNFIAEHRPQMDLAPVATGEVWTGSQALVLGLVDKLETSDEVILRLCKESDVFKVSWERRRHLRDKIEELFENSVSKVINGSIERWLHRADKEKYFS